MGRTLRVLIAEDRPENAERILAALTSGGFDPTWERVETADALRAALASGPWDAVTSAFTMAGFGASEALRIVRADYPDLPFVVVSETVGEDAAVALMRDGANDCVRKHDLPQLAPALERETRTAETRRAPRIAERSAEHWAAVVESSDDAIISKTLDGVLTSWNRAAERLFGWSAAEAVGRPISFMIPADKADELAEILRRLAAGEKVEYFETVRLHRDGRRIDVSMTVSPVRGPDGRLTGISKTSRDVRARRAAEESMRASEERFRGAFDNTGVAMVITDIAHRFVRVNAAFGALFGYAPAEMLGMTMAEVTHPDDRTESYAQRERLLSGASSFFQMEKRYRHRDGRVLSCLTNVSLIRGADGAPLQYVSQVQDLTEKKRGEADLAFQHALLRCQTEASPDGILVVGPGSRVLSYNRRFPVVWGISEEVAASGDDSVLLETARSLTADPDAFLARVQEIYADPDSPSHDEVALADGRFLDRYSGSFRSDDGELLGRVWYFRDITTRKHAEAAVEQSEALKAAILESALDAIVTIDAAGRIVEFNPSAERTFGFSRSESLGKDVADLIIPPAYRERHRQGMAHYRTTGEGPMLGRRLEMSATRAGGAEFPVEIAITPHPIRGHLHFTAFLRDLTEQKRAEAERDALFAQLNLQIERMPLAYLLSGTDFRYTRWNPAAERMFGFREAEVLGQHPCETIVPLQSRDLVQGIFDRLAHGDMEAGGTCENITKDGRIIVCEWHNTPLVGPDGRFQSFLSLAQDVTARKRASEALGLSEMRYRRLFEAAFDGILIVDPVTRRVFDANPFLVGLIGYSRDELIGKELWELGMFQDIESNREAFHTLQRDGNIRYDDLPLRTKDGRQIAVEFVSSAYEVGDTRVIQCNIRDITERKRAEGELRLRDRAIRAATQGILITDASLPDNPIVYASPGFERLTGYESRDALGRNCRFLQCPDTDPEAVARLRRAIRLGEPCTVELFNGRKDGTTFWNELSISPVHDAAGTLTHFVGVQSDVTARRNLEEQFRQAQKLEAVGQLAGGIAHDFNNLLTVINGYSELLLLDLKPGNPARELVDEIHKAGERSAGLTRQLLAFSRQQVLALQILDLNAVVTDTEKMLRRLIGEDIRVAAALTPDLGWVRADPGQIEQVLMNLAVNARDAMPRGGRLTIETRNIDLDEAYMHTHADATIGPHILLSVADSGTGMPPDVAARIFEPFFTTKGVCKGTGLGLATVYGIVKQSGGHVAVYSEVGVGTTFKVYLPRVEEPPAPTKGKSWLQPPPHGTETVLVVEDEEGVRVLNRLILTGCGYTVLEAADGEEALRVLAGHTGPIHLLISDVVMPGVGGRVVAERVRQTHPDVRVLFVSGYTDDAVIRHGILQEGVNFLQKPFSAAALAIKVRQVLDETGR